MIREVVSIAPPSHFIEKEVLEYCIPPNSPIELSDVECSLCLGVYMRPVQLNCGEMCCMACFCEWVKHTSTLSPLCCPCCLITHEVNTSEFHPAPQVMLKLLDSLCVLCRRCFKKVPAVQHLDHIESGCRSHAVQEEVPSLLHHFSTSSQNILSVPTGGRVRKKNTFRM